MNPTQWAATFGSFCFLAAEQLRELEADLDREASA